jgi:lipopolysaccharide cholinephosphotransferase
VCDFEDEELDNLFKGKRRMTLKEMQQTEKEILRYVDELCVKNNLRYWVCGGTLLGTIRHKGFIPWDDDIDIFLPWEDYLKFIDIFEENEDYAMLGMGTSKVNDFSDIFAKVVYKKTVINEDIGTVRKVNPLWIDVFPLVGLPKDDDERTLFFKKYQELNRQIWEDFYATNGSLDVFPKWYPKQREFLERYDFDRSEYVGVLGTAYGERDSTTRGVYSDTQRKPFEDIGVNVPIGYKEYLDNLYGRDWMQLPDESKRQSHHEVEAYWL